MNPRSPFIALAVGLVASSIASAASAAKAACQLQKLIEVPVIMEGLRPMVTAQINGQSMEMAVATGNFFSDVSPQSAARAGMTPAPTPFGLEVTGMGGRSRDAKAVRAKQFTFAGAGFKDIDFLLLDGGGQGAIGENILGPFDVEYDFANGVMRIFKAVGCGDAILAYWGDGKTISSIPLEGENKVLQEVVARGKIDGHSIHVKFSSASGVSYVSRPAAQRAGIQLNAEGVSAAGITYGAYGKALETSIAPFASFAIGDEEIKNTRLRVADIDLGATDMLLGTDFFLSHRIMVSGTQHRLYFTYNGGPVFKLDGAQPTRQAQATQAAAAPAGADGAPKTAAEFAQQGSALAARREFVAAIEAFDKAIALEGSDSATFRARAMARFANRQPVLGMSDLDQAVKLAPNDPKALLMRGQVYLQSKDTTRARADFAAAQQAAPNERSVRMEIASAYMRAGDYEQAVAQYDGWIAAHPKEAGAVQLLAARCNARATWGQQLEAGIGDCDQALKVGGKVSDVMENRGVILLRLGRLDEAIKQFDAALQVQPKAAWALYGRGLAKLRKGAKPEGEADIAAAVAIRPNVPVEAKRYGLEPGAAPVPAKS
jgi:tetratricopeptide (TPR) repeat protein